MRARTHFLTQLDNLWLRRTATLRALVSPRGVGQPPKFSRTVRDRLIGEILEDATSVLINDHGHAAFTRVTSSRHLRQIRGRGLLERGRNLLSWADNELNGPIIYVFWRGRKCLYVGKSSSPRRLWDYEKSAYLIQATCLEVFHVPRVSELGEAECLATHLFGPRDQKIQPSREKWGKKCPICQRHDAIREELQALFRMK